MCCGNKKSTRNISIYINGKEFKIGSRFVSSALKELARSMVFADDIDYDFEMINNATKAKQEGILTFKRGFPYLNGRRVN